MLQVDTSRTARSHADKVALIQAIVAAPVGEPETTGAPTLREPK